MSSIFEDEEWFTLDDITESDNDETLYCISVDSSEKQFLIGNNIAIPTHNTDEGKADDELKGEAAMILSSIARLGRAAGVHLVIATQRPDATVISGEAKANLGVRINCGRTDSTASNMILGTGDGMRVRANPRGRLYLRIYGNGDHGQGFFAPASWIDEYLQSKGLNSDGSPIGGRQSRLANVADMSQFAEGDLDSREGVDNSAIIEQIRESEHGTDTYDDNDDNDGFPTDEDWGFDTIEDTTPAKEDKLGRPELNTGGADPRKFARPEDDWDTDLDDLISENNS